MPLPINIGWGYNFPNFPCFVLSCKNRNSAFLFHLQGAQSVGNQPSTSK